MRDEARRRGMKPTRAHVVAVAKHLFEKIERGRESKWFEKLRALPDDALLERYGEDFLKRIRTADLARLRAGGTVPSTQTAAAPKVDGPANSGRHKTFSNFDDLLADRRSKSGA